MVSRIITACVLVFSIQFVLGCGQAEVPATTDGDVVIPQARLIDIVRTKYPELYKDIAVQGVAPDDVVLLFLVKRGGTYVYRRGEGQELEVVHHAKAIMPSSITRITYEDRAFKLWSGDKLQLTLAGYP